MARVFDLTKEQTDPPKKYKKFRRVDAKGRILPSRKPGGKVVRRDPSQVTGITIHQTACVFGLSRASLRWANGDLDKAKHYEALDVACHVLACDCGHAVHSAPFDWYVYHGNGFNAYQLGLEIEGRYRGRMMELPNGEPAFQATDKIIDASCAALKYMVEKGRKMGMPIEWIYAHRQSSATRRGDPGEELWKRVVIMYAVPILGLKTDPELAVGKGRPIPKEWDFAGKGKF